MKRAFIIHGWGGDPEEAWFPWLKKGLEKNDYQVSIPAMPDTENPKIEVWVNHLASQIGTADDETVLIGHSIGCQTILRYLQTLKDNVKIKCVVLVAPFVTLLDTSYEDEEKEKVIAKPWLETPLYWDKIKIHTNNFSTIFSDNDECVPLSDSKIFKDKLNANVIIEHEKGHFGREDEILELPSVLKEILKF